MIVRVAEPGDVNDLVALMEAFYAESNYPLDRSWAKAALLQLMSKPDWGCIWLARRGANAVGHAVLSVRYTMEHCGLSAYVDDLFVRREHRRQGVARGLLSELLAECRKRGCAAACVEVAHHNRAALGLYSAFGLRPHQDGRQLLVGPILDARG
jgi:GNAT superfamily N-acetyltransferase